MKALRLFLVLIPVLAVVVVLAGLLGLDGLFGACGLTLVVSLFVTFVWAVWLLVGETKKRYGTPVGWDEAQVLYPLPESIDGIRIRGYLKENERGRFFSCRVWLDAKGALIKDGQPVLSFGGIYVPWEMLGNPRKADLTWYVRYAPLWWQETAMELPIRGTGLSLVVSTGVWSRHSAPQMGEAALGQASI